MKKSAGILLYKWYENKLRIFLVHPGGPFWKNKDLGAWSIPKGEIEEGEKNQLDVAKRELKEETGIDIFSRKNDEFTYLESVIQKSGKEVFCWAIEADWPGLLICSSYVELEWPIHSKKIIKFPEVDKANFFSLETARKRLNPAQVSFIDRLEKLLEKN
ncbi:NUDIX domain-containing protein [Candidatus Pacearchaeota archaeon]|nr:NUDIX domain-containing protein [Candidatus Pacearchaeota archaeon]